MATTIRQKDGVVILEPSGKIMGSSVSELREAITSPIDASETPRILINFDRVNMMDSSGLGTLMGAMSPQRERKGVSVSSTSEQISKI